MLARKQNPRLFSCCCFLSISFEKRQQQCVSSSPSHQRREEGGSAPALVSPPHVPTNSTTADLPEISFLSLPLCTVVLHLHGRQRWPLLPLVGPRPAMGTSLLDVGLNLRDCHQVSWANALVPSHRKEQDPFLWAAF